MKSFRKMIMLPIVILSLASCKTFIDDALSNAGSDGWTATSMLTALYAAGYENLGYANDQGTWDFRESKYLEDYDLTVEVIGFYQGYVNGDERWMMMEVFGSTSDANDVFGALTSDSSITHYVVIESNVVLQTSSYETSDLFW